MDIIGKIDWNHLLDGPIVPLTFCSIVCLTLILAGQWRRVRIAETEAALKSKMIDKGYSAAEMERVCKLQIDNKPHNRFWRHNNAQQASYSD